jgi:hypothetical protein
MNLKNFLQIYSDGRLFGVSMRPEFLHHLLREKHLEAVKRGRR